MITAIILAAGTSTRLGTPKQLLLYKGCPLLRQTVNTLMKTKVNQIIVVLGHEADKIAKVLHGLPVQIVVNKDYLKGQSSSLKSGLSAYSNWLSSQNPDNASFLHGHHQGILFALCDQPLVKHESVNLLIERFQQNGGIVVPVYSGRRGNPVIMEQKYLSEFNSITGDVGARDIIINNAHDVSRVEVDDKGVIFDIDTLEDYRQLT